MDEDEKVVVPVIADYLDDSKSGRSAIHKRTLLSPPGRAGMGRLGTLLVDERGLTSTPSA